MEYHPKAPCPPRYLSPSQGNANQLAHQLVLNVSRHYLWVYEQASLQWSQNCRDAISNSFDPREITTSIKHPKCSKASGVDNMSVEQINISTRLIFRGCSNFLTTVWNLLQFPVSGVNPSHSDTKAKKANANPVSFVQVVWEIAADSPHELNWPEFDFSGASGVLTG